MIPSSNAFIYSVLAVFIHNQNESILQSFSNFFEFILYSTASSVIQVFILTHHIKKISIIEKYHPQILDHFQSASAFKSILVITQPCIFNPHWSLHIHTLVRIVHQYFHNGSFL